MKKINEGHGDKIELIKKDTLNKFSNLEASTEDKIASMRKLIRDAMDLLHRKNDVTRFDDFKKEINNRADTLYDKIKELSKKFDPTIDRVNLEM
mmetsp:Transcript_30396/g.27637  ORF Transcript_30396/g.27637 Transcript_30396/m.27637 type:complete len:94 (-) Transcript_30396:716-997(-)|eukprot:CAMPEP_0114581000 /NCGR_PEP_ID=MMETSP0125-20121206/5158_1 /TAXON_ID=485358 ORGANISM="Aristerostoma sp., Strain ATCC 50986" /NCGR_SAMPLE_ID=MMETSP0125 /ASSEMBLY_ACC=CAM_ASM_000245 /LENGTH=93 /DNA_ID=CAMNT_0001772869 /DNA_START=802 /DNA_END=1083 /DNA_ORIENTATION=+